MALIEKLRTDAGRYWLQRNVGYVSRPGERDHLEVLEHIRQGDHEGAVESLAEHLRHVCEQLVEIMEQQDER